MKMKSKKKTGAMEMSMGTIVTIVLSVSLLVVGIFFISQISKVSTGVVDLTEAQLRDQINKLFSEESKLMIYPQNKFVQIKQESSDGVGVGIRNLIQGSSGDTEFSYVVLATDTSDCGISEEEAESWIITGKEESNIPIASGDSMIDKVLFRIPVGAPLCIVKFRVNVDAGGDAYATDSFNIEVKAK
jgi:hypothetical protein